MRLDYRDFEFRVKQYFRKIKEIELFPKRLEVGPNLFHEFDLVSKDGTMIIECKSYTWTNGDNFPSAKISTANEALFYLSRVLATRKILVMQDDLSGGSSLVETYVRRYNGLMDDTEVWSYVAGNNIEDDSVNVVRKTGQIWYKKLYC